MNRHKVKKRVVTKVYPWYNKDEFLCVYEALYSDNSFQNLWACNKIEIWKNRYYPAIPSGIDATAALVRSLVHDDYSIHNFSLCKIPDLCQMYAMSLIRFVNTATELVQGREKATPVRTAAEKLDIPDWIVNLRHSASHSRMPSISMLREGTRDALCWLRREYWLEMEKSFVNFYSTSVKKDEVTDVKEFITTYIEYQEMCILSKPRRSKELFEMLLVGKPAYDRALEKIKRLLMYKPEKFLHALVQPSCFLLLPEQMVNVLTKHDIELLENCESLSLPKNLFVFWKPLIRIINYFGHMPSFLSRLLKSRNFEPFQQKMACAWAFKLINVVLTEGPWDFFDPIVSIYHEKNWLFHWHEVMVLCFLNASKYMPAVILTFINDFYPPLKEGVKQYLLAVLVTYLDGVPCDITNSEEKHHTWKNTEEDAELQWLARHDGKVYHTSTTFKVAEDDVDWATMPLGIIMGSESDDFISGIPPEIMFGDKIGEKKMECEDTNVVSSSDSVVPAKEKSIMESTESQSTMETESPVISSDYVDTTCNIEEDGTLY